MENYEVFEQIKAYFIDFDRTLVDSIKIEKKALTAALKALGVYREGMEFEHKNSFKEMIKNINQKYGLDLDFDTVDKEFIKQALPLYQNECELKDGAYEFWLWARKNNKKIYVITLNERQFVTAVLEKYGLKADGIYTRRDTGIHKRDGALFLYAFSDAGFEPRECAVIEDYPYYIIAIKDLGCKIVGMYDSQSEDEINL
ncbi:MAG: HAD family phosphatase [Clostridiales bacterium]|nr:HAD family phosphatase [Clostridiales bacterium]